VIWIEILSRHHDVIARHRCDATECRIGRGYDNDVVIDDPYVAPHHLRVYRDDAGKLVAEDLGSVNGLHPGASAQTWQRVIVDGDQVLRVGRTSLRIRESSHAVAPERAAAPAVRTWPRALGLAAAVLAIELVSAWLGETSEPKASRYLLPLLILAVLTLAWTTAWAILSRIFAGHARFERHLVIALTALLAFSLYEETVEAGAFAMSWSLLGDYAYVGVWALFATLCYFHLREVGVSHRKLKAVIVIGLGATAIAAQTLAQSEMRPWMNRQSYLHDLKPPFMRLAAPQGEDAFFSDAQGLKAKLDRARSDEPPGGGFPALDTED
jgi:hypothetical protein